MHWRYRCHYHNVHRWVSYWIFCTESELKRYRRKQKRRTWGSFRENCSNASAVPRWRTNRRARENAQVRRRFQAYCLIKFIELCWFNTNSWVFFFSSNFNPKHKVLSLVSHRTDWPGFGQNIWFKVSKIKISSIGKLIFDRFSIKLSSIISDNM